MRMPAAERPTPATASMKGERIAHGQPDKSALNFGLEYGCLYWGMIHVLLPEIGFE